MSHTLSRFAFLAAAFLLPLLVGCATTRPVRTPANDDPFILVLGTAQDAGYPQAACRRDCCNAAWADPSLARFTTSLAIVDPATNQRWLIDATPDLPEQLHLLDAAPPGPRSTAHADLSGILLTHAHIGHYTGLMHLGREVIGGPPTTVYAMPRMKSFLETNGPWSLLVEANHITIVPLAADEPVQLNDRIAVTPILVPHRDEYSETVGYRIEGPGRSVLFIPDIDKWTRWDEQGRSIEAEIAGVDIAYLDGTFFANGEIEGRDMADIPHPFIEESMARLAALPAAERAKVRFIHLNHTNPAIRQSSTAAREIRAAGFGLAIQGERIPLAGR